MDKTRLPHRFGVIESGAQITIEERDADEVCEVNETLITMLDANVLDDAFDVTPNELITAIVTEHGIARPPYRQAFRALLNR